MKNTTLESVALTVLSPIALCVAGSANAQQSMNDLIGEKLGVISKSCEDQGLILAEARINKWKKAGQNVEEHLGVNAFSIISKVMHQQYVSIQHVALPNAKHINKATV
jgi:hypothetical protein